MIAEVAPPLRPGCVWKVRTLRTHLWQVVMARPGSHAPCPLQFHTVARHSVPKSRKRRPKRPSLRPWARISAARSESTATRSGHGERIHRRLPRADPAQDTRDLPNVIPTRPSNSSSSCAPRLHHPQGVRPPGRSGPQSHLPRAGVRPRRMRAGRLGLVRLGRCRVHPSSATSRAPVC